LFPFFLCLSFSGELCSVNGGSGSIS
jgi:hypothetical protein